MTAIDQHQPASSRATATLATTGCFLRSLKWTQPEAAPAVDALRRPKEGARDRQRCHRPRAGWLVLVPGRHGRLTRDPARRLVKRLTMTRNRPQPAWAVPRRPTVCQCSSASTLFMLAALRVLHVDSSHAPAGIAWIEERPSLTQHRPRPKRFLPPTHKKATGPRKRGGGCAWSDLRSDYEQQWDSHP